MDEENNMDEYFKLMNDGMNKDVKKREEDINLKMDVIKEVERREKLEKEEGKKEDINLNNFFENMKVKTKDSDVNAAKSQTDIVNISKRIDKLETYLFDILNNQLNILEKLDKLENFKTSTNLNNNIFENIKNSELSAI